MKRLSALMVSLALTAATPVFAQDRTQTLADIRQDLSVLFVEVQRLKRELSTTGTPGVAVAGGSTLERVDAIEQELQRLTAKTEQLEFRVNSVVTDGTNRIGDLEFRLVELEGGDVSELGDTPTLGGVDVPAGPSGPVASTGDGAVLAQSEQADFDRAKEALDQGSFRSAVDQFETYSQTYSGGPLSAEAHFLRGSAYEGLGEMSSAARAYLESFSGAPNGPRAPQALFKLGTSLGALGQTNEACVTLGEVEARFPNDETVLEARSAQRNLGCS